MSSATRRSMLPRRDAQASSPFSLIQFRGIGGAVASVPKDDTAFSHRQQSYFVAIIGLWLDPSEELPSIAPGPKRSAVTATTGAASTPTSSRRKATGGSRRPTHRPHTSACRGSRLTTTQTTSSASTRTFHPRASQSSVQTMPLSSERGIAIRCGIAIRPVEYTRVLARQVLSGARLRRAPPRHSELPVTGSDAQDCGAAEV